MMSSVSSSAVRFTETTRIEMNLVNPLPPLHAQRFRAPGLLFDHWFVLLLITKVTFTVKSPISPFGSSRQLAPSVQLSVALTLFVTWFNIIIIVPRCTGTCKLELLNLNTIVLGLFGGVGFFLSLNHAFS